MRLGDHRYGDLSEEELLRLFTQSGDEEGFAEFFRRYSRKVYCACHGFFGDAGLAEDATQETFMRAYQSKDRFNGGDYLSWLRRIARNVCIDHWRSKRCEVSIDGGEDDSPMQIANPEPDKCTKVAVQQLHKEIAKLPGEQRRCVELKIERGTYRLLTVAVRLPFRRLTRMAEKAMLLQIQEDRPRAN
jgi:RNA polymerase sigma factor (sigma-70 family)